MFMPTQILVPTDFSEYSDKALEQALNISKQYHAKVFLPHVVYDEIYRTMPPNIRPPPQYPQKGHGMDLSIPC
jgi:nucleotide-binding universal stress UspA family protein